MKLHHAIAALLLTLSSAAWAELSVPAFTAYIAPNAHGAKVSKENGVTAWTKDGTKVLWFGEFKMRGTVHASVVVNVPVGKTLQLKLSLDQQQHSAVVQGGASNQKISLGDYSIVDQGYARFELELPASPPDPKAAITALVLDGAPADTAHFNLEPRRNAASVHLKYPLPEGAEVTAFYNEVTGIEDPVTTYYMACGFTRGYLGMQVNSATERRIIFSVWDSGSGVQAKDRSTVSQENQVQLLAKGENVNASVFGNEGTGGHSDFKYNWKTGSVQRFVVTAKLDGDHTIYTGWWYHPDKQQWMMLASFRAPKDGKYLHGLYSFSENFGGDNGHLLRKALYGPQWIRLANGTWKEITKASFSHDGTGKSNRIDRYMGVEHGLFFLSHGGFVPGYTPFGEGFTRPASGVPPKDLEAVLAPLR